MIHNILVLWRDSRSITPWQPHIKTVLADCSRLEVLVASERIRREVPRLAFNQQEAAEALGISVDHFERHIKAELPVVYTGARRLYTRAGLERWLAEHEIRGGRRVA